MLDKRAIAIILHHYKFPRELFHISEQFSIFHEARWNINSNAKQVSKKNRDLSPPRLSAKKKDLIKNLAWTVITKL